MLYSSVVTGLGVVVGGAGSSCSAAQRLLRIVTIRRRVLIGVPRVTWALPAREGP
jgi:hypothetical protein